MRLIALPLLASAALAVPAQAQADRYEAEGPGWTLSIGGAMYLNGAGVRSDAPTPRPVPIRGGRRFVAEGFTVDVTDVRCALGKRRYPDTVTVRVEGRVLKGCGGLGGGAASGPRPGAGVDAGGGGNAMNTLAEGEYRVSAIGGLRVISGRPARLTFSGGRISGDVGCNRLSGSYRQARGQLIPGPMISTKMACPGPLMRQEDALMAILSGPVDVRTQFNGQTVLQSGRGVGDIVLERR